MTTKAMSEAVDALAKSNFEAEMGDGWENLPAQIRPGWIKEAERQIAALSAAGFGLVADAKAGALEEAADIADRPENQYWAEGKQRAKWLRNLAANIRSKV